MRTVLVIVLAVLFGGAAAYLVNAWVAMQRVVVATPPPETLPPPPPVVETVPVVVAAVEVPRDVMVTPDLLKTRDWPKSHVLPGTITKPEDAVGRVALGRLPKDGPVLDDYLAPKGAGRGLAALVPPEMRGYTIMTPNIVSGVAGFILPGNKVDVLLTMGDRTITLLQHVEILAVDQRLDAPAENKVDPKELRCVTLLVTPYQAARLALAQTEAEAQKTKWTLHLSLRNPGDEEPAKTRPAYMEDLRVEEKPESLPESLPGLSGAKSVATLADPGVEEKPRRVPEPPPHPEPPPPPAAPEPPLRVRTIRGVQEGAVYVLPPPKAPPSPVAVGR